MRPTVFPRILTVMLMLCATCASALDIEERARFGADGNAPVLRILSTADIEFFTPVIQSYLSQNPDVAIDYVVASSTEVMRAVQDGDGVFDLVISSAMDLQTKLANDGYALRHTSDATQALPDWATWNDMLFAFTQEPAAIVVSRAAFAGEPVPRTRHDLIELLRQDDARFHGRVGTYDVRQSGLGYLFATQDTRASDTFWRLAEVMGALDVQLYCCSSDMIEDVRSGRLLIAYNVLGSYVANRSDRDEFEIILPADFTTVMLRTALIPRNAASPNLSRDFIDNMVTRAFSPEVDPLVDQSLNMPQAANSLNRIDIGPGLLVFLDQLKRQTFVSEWENAILQDP